MELELAEVLKKYGCLYRKLANETSFLKIYNLWIQNMFTEPDETKPEQLFYYGLYYQQVKKNYDLTKKYYLMGVELEEDNAMNALGYYYEKVEKNYDLMKKYFLMAIELGNSNSMINLGYYYEDVEKNYELMKKYYLMGIELGESCNMNNLGSYYLSIENNYELAKKYYLMGAEKNNCHCIFNLGAYYQILEKNYDLMKQYYSRSIKIEPSHEVTNLLGYYKQEIEDISFIQFAVENSVTEEFTDLLNERFKFERYLPPGLYNDFCQFKNGNRKIKMKQYILRKTTIFPIKYNTKYDIEFMELLSMSSYAHRYVLPKDILLLIAGYLHL